MFLESYTFYEILNVFYLSRKVLLYVYYNAFTGYNQNHRRLIKTMYKSMNKELPQYIFTFPSRYINKNIKGTITKVG